MLSIIYVVLQYYLLSSVLSADGVCQFRVLSVDHSTGPIGMYFNFDISTVNDILGEEFKTGDYKIKNWRTNAVVDVRMWSNSNGGSSGDGHGRINPKGNAKAGDWQKDDLLFLLVDADGRSWTQFCKYVYVNGAMYRDIGDTLKFQSKINEGQALVSLNGRYLAAMQHDGNFVVYDKNNGNSLWSTHTAYKPRTSFVYLLAWTVSGIPYGNIYVFHNGKVAKTIENPLPNNQKAKHLVMQNDGNLVGYTVDSNEPFFATK
eukprot:140683_1